MEVIFNQQTIQLPDAITLAEALALFGIQQPAGIAVAVNDDVIPKSEWSGCILSPSDEVFIIRATQGG